MIDSALCVSALAALFYQYAANEEEYIRCVHVPLATILSRSFTAAWIMFAVTVIRTTVLIYAVNHNLQEKTVHKTTAGMANLYCMLMVTCTAIVFLPFVINRLHTVYGQVELCVTDKELIDMTVPFAWVGCIGAALIFYIRPGSDQSDYVFCLEFCTHFIPLITIFYWLNDCAITAGIYNMSPIVLALCAVFSTVFSLVTFPALPTSRGCTVPDGKETLITVI